MLINNFDLEKNQKFKFLNALSKKNLKKQIFLYTLEK